MSTQPEKIDFLKIHTDIAGLTGFWDEHLKRVIMRMIEREYKQEVIREWGIDDIVIHGDKVLLKWYKRMNPLSDEELKNKFE